MLVISALISDNPCKELLTELMRSNFVHLLNPEKPYNTKNLEQILLIIDAPPPLCLEISHFKAIVLIANERQVLWKEYARKFANFFCVRKEEASAQLPRIFATLKTHLQVFVEQKVYNEIYLDSENLELCHRKGQTRASLTQKEAQLLRLFIENPKRLISKDELKKRIWSGTAISPRTIDSQISRLRSKLESFGVDIENHYGAGFIFS